MRPNPSISGPVVGIGGRIDGGGPAQRRSSVGRLAGGEFGAQTVRVQQEDLDRVAD